MRRYLTAALTAAMLVGLLPFQALAGETPQTVAITSTAPVDAVVGGPTYTVTATASSDLEPVLSIDDLSTGVCELSGTTSGSTVSFTGVGTCSIHADQEGDTVYAAAPQDTQAFGVGQGTQAITITSTPPAAAVVGGPTYTVAANGGSSGNAVTFSIDGSSAGACTIAGSVVSFVHAGTCTIDANQAGNVDYADAIQVQQSFTIGKGAQAITFTSTAPSGAVVSGPTYTPAATSGSGLPVTFTIHPDSSGICTIAGGVVSFTGAGICTVLADQAGDLDWNPAPQESQAFTVAAHGSTPQTITFDLGLLPAKTYGDAPFNISSFASVNSPLTVGFGSLTPGVCTTSGIHGATVTILAAGDCTISADQAGDATYAPAATVSRTFTVGKATLTVTADNKAITFGQPDPAFTFTYGAFVGSDGPLVIDTPPTCTVAGAHTGVAGSPYTITCAGGVDNDYTFDYFTGHLTVSKAGQAITFTSTAPSGAIVGGPTYTVTATGGASGSPVTFSIDASSAGACTISGSTVSFVHAGTCTIDANQAGTADYADAPRVQQGFSIGKGAQAITFTSTAPSGAVVGDPDYTVTATGGASGSPVVFSIDAASTTVCTISGSTVSFIGKGDCRVNANQSGNADYNAAPQVHQSFGVGVKDQVITFSTTAPVSAVYGQAYSVAATATSGLPVTLTIDPASSAVCSISGATVSFIGTGTCTINANQAGNGTWNVAPQVQQSFSVGRAGQTVSFTSTAPGSAVIGGTYVVSAAATSGLSVTFTSAAPSVCTVSGSLVSFVARGECVIDANQAGNANWNAATGQQRIGVGDQAPSCSDASASVVMNVPKTGAAGCTDPELDALSYSIVGDGAHGHATIDGAGNWTYAPAANFTGPDTFTYRANDGILDSNVATITVTVTNQPLDARNDGVAFVNPIDPTSIDVLANDSPGAGEAGQPLTITAVGNGAKGRVTTNGATVTYDPSGCSVGTDTFTYTVSDGQLSATKSVFLTIAGPGQNGLSSNPITDIPAQSLITNSTVGSTVPVRLSWCGILRSGSALRSFTVQQSTNGGRSYASRAIISGTRSASSTRNLSVWTSYSWRARTIDSAGRTGSYRASSTTMVGRYQESSPAIVYTGGWGRSTTSKASGGAEKYAYSAAASATITLTNVRQFAIVGPRSSARGSFHVYVDGVWVARISEHAHSTVYRRVLYVRGLAPGTHTVRIVPVGNGRIDLDAILSLS